MVGDKISGSHPEQRIGQEHFDRSFPQEEACADIRIGLSLVVGNDVADHQVEPGADNGVEKIQEHGNADKTREDDKSMLLSSW